MRVLTKRPKDITASNFFVMKRFVSDELIKYDGPYVYIQGLLFRATNKMTNVEVEHFDREVGSSGYTFKALVRLWSNVLNFSMVPLRAGTVIGAAIAAISFIVAIVLIVQRLINPSIQLGWSSIMVTITFFAGSILLFLGLMGEYLGRLFMMANKAPQYVTRASINCEKDDDEK